MKRIPKQEYTAEFKASPSRELAKLAALFRAAVQMEPPRLHVRVAWPEDEVVP